MISEIIRSFYINKKNKNNPDFKKVDFLQAARRSFRVGLFDIDFNMHINNAKYLNYMERARWDLFVQQDKWDAVIKAKLNFIVASVEIGYIREINLFKKFEIESRYLGWDEKYFYLEQRFIADGKVYSYALIKAVFLQKKKLATPEKVIHELGVTETPEPLPEHIELWKKLNTAKRAYSEATANKS